MDTAKVFQEHAVLKELAYQSLQEVSRASETFKFGSLW